MPLNHRFLLRLITNLVIFALALSSLGVLLWIVDELIGWDILPDAISIYVRAIVIGVGWVTATLIIAHILLSLTLFAESTASRAQLPDFQVSEQLMRRLKRIFLVAGLISILVITGLQVTDMVRKNIALQVSKQEATQEQQKAFNQARAKFNQIQQVMDQSLPKILPLFTPSLLAAIATNQIPAADLNQLLESVTVSFPHQPALALLIPADSPYKYAKIDQPAIDFNHKSSTFVLRPQHFVGFPSSLETKVVDQLFGGQTSKLTTSLNGVFINNTQPSSWGVLKYNKRVVALIYLGVNYQCPQRSEFIKEQCIHPGPGALHSN
jgi:hypothetical protein